MANHRRNAQQRHFASTELSRLAKVNRRRNAVPATKEAQRELAAQTAAEHPITRLEQPCKNESRFVHHDGSCLRCGAVQGEACRDAKRS